jgi:hypothetical protein
MTVKLGLLAWSVVLPKAGVNSHFSFAGSIVDKYIYIYLVKKIKA